MAVVKALKASVGDAGVADCGLSSDAVVATIGAEVVSTGNTEVVAAAVVGTTAVADDPGPDMADTRLLELKDLRAQECERGGLGLKPRRRTGGAVLDAWLETRRQQGDVNSNARGPKVR